MNSQLLKVSLLVTRFFVFWMMALWAWARITTEGAPGFYRFYSLGGIDFTVIPPSIIGYLMLGLYILFFIGFKKTITYLLVFAIHGFGILLTLPESLPFFDVFRSTWFTSWPALMAMWLLWVQRDEDTLLSLKGKWG